MAVKQKGLGVVWGVSTTNQTYTGSATVLNVKHTGQSYRKSSQKFECKDNNGETNGLVFFDARKELTLRCYPSGATLAAAKTNNVLPDPGDKFVVTDADDPDVAGTYVVEECSKEKVNNGITTFDIRIIEYVSDLSADTT
jgi:hypothetical protein